MSNDQLETREFDACPARLDRRAMLIGAGVAAAGLIGYPLARRLLAKKQPVFLARQPTYDIATLERTIDDGLAAAGLELPALRGREVLLKPNFVEPHRDSPHMTTHPAVIVAAAEVFRRHGARVRVGEGPGHVRDAQMALVEAGVDEVLQDADLEFIDLNHDDVAAVPNAGGCCKLSEFFLPRAVLEADLIVSLPKLKTHHWVGMTAATKNLYGLLPGIKYGWPKNVLHYAGIPESVADIHATVAELARVRSARGLATSATVPNVIGVVDAIDCMEGDGPIMGSSKHLGVVAIGTNLTALDATCARLMGLEPSRIGYLKRAAGRLGPVSDWQIEQRGEGWRALRSPFAILDQPHLQRLREEVLIS